MEIEFSHWKALSVYIQKGSNSIFQNRDNFRSYLLSQLMVKSILRLTTESSYWLETQRHVHPFKNTITNHFACRLLLMNTFWRLRIHRKMYFGRWDDKKGCVYALLKKAFKSVFVQDYSKESSSYKTFSVFGPNIAKYKGETIFWICFHKEELTVFHCYIKLE